MKKIMVINGPNLNFLGIREKHIYGDRTYESLCNLVEESAKEMGVAVEIFQSNHEGVIVDKIQECYNRVDGIVINPAAYTHTSVAILDALKAVNIPAVEVHISDVDSREEFRKKSYAGMYCFARVAGEGFEGYVKAMKILLDEIEKKCVPICSCKKGTFEIEIR